VDADGILANMAEESTPVLTAEAGTIAWADNLAEEVASAVPDHLVGAYVHGSAALGGFVAGRSDVDLLFVVARPLSNAEKARAAEVLATFPGSPGSGIECSFLTREQAADPERGRFELHLSTGPGAKVVDGSGHPGDEDLVLHSVVARAAGVALIGPPAATLFGEVPRPIVLQRIAAELGWGLEHGSEAYAVLNACRGLLFAEHGSVASKLHGGEWGLARFPRRAALIRHALDAQAGHDEAAIGADAREFVKSVIQLVEAAQEAGP
jgi:streptomycin 3"-adenylyltransferase